MPAPLYLDRPIFIVGPGRSGTTLLRSLLSAHSRIAITPETQFMARAQQWGLSTGSPADFEAFWKDYTSWLRFRDLGIEAGRCRELIESQGDASFQNIFRAVLQTYLEKTGKQRIGEKTPHHSKVLPTLLDWFPDARILFTQRDPRAVIASQMKTWYVQRELTPRSLRHGVLTGNREQEIALFARDWVENFEQRLAPWLGDPRFYTVVYENLVQDPDKELRRIFTFLEEDFEAEILATREASVPMHAARDNDSQMEKWRQKHHERSVSTISGDSIGKWKTELTKVEVAIIEGQCRETMHALGYTPSLSSSARRAGRAASSAILLSHAAEMHSRGIFTKGTARLRNIRRRAGNRLDRIATAGIARGFQPALFGYRGIIRESVQDYFARYQGSERAGRYETIHPEAVAHNGLPFNVSSLDELPDDRGWWGYSFRDVPHRISSETFIATVPDCLITWYRNPEQENDFYPAILNRDSRAFDMREVRFRPPHAYTLRHAPEPVRLKKATWFIERVYHNHSHWLTAHLPRLLLLRDRGLLDQIILPPERTASMDGSLRMLGLDPDQFQTFDVDRPLFVEELTILGTDRFRPELLQMIPEAFGVTGADTPSRRIFISRLKATRRRLVNEDEVWSLLEPLGFERVLMEEMTFADQVQLMRETAILVAPHGAGLTNMVFCPRGALIVEIADLGFPNPNFYAVASALGHKYWLIPAESLGDLDPLEKDLEVDPEAVRDILSALIPPSEGVTRETA